MRNTMTKRIFKYKLGSRVQDIMMPVGSRIIHVESQFGIPCLWAEVDTGLDVQLNKRRFVIINTGDSIPNSGLRYVGTFFLENGAYVGHVYEDEMI